MIKVSAWAVLGALLSFGLASPSIGAERGDSADATTVAERLLGSAREEAQARDCLPFSRQFSVSGLVTGSLAASAAAAGVPAAAMLDALRAFGTAIDLNRAPRDGDRFHVHYEQTFTVQGHPIGVGRVLWAELVSEAKGTIVLHRFRPLSGVERFWLASGEAAALPSILLPLDVVDISSGFGPRIDPRGASRGTAAKVPAMGPLRGGHGWRLGRSRALSMHDGVDLVAPRGTPVHAASDGIVIGARANGGYGNWIRIDHQGDLSTIYAHLSRFAPGIKAGARVSRGALIGYVGNTGRSTGPHLHFELLSNGKPVDPIVHPEVTRAQLYGPDLERFGKQMTNAQAERDRGIALSVDF